MTTTDNPTLRVVVADDQAAVREGLVTLLDILPDIAVPDIALVGAAADGDHALALVEQHAPDVVLMDLRMPGVDGIEATRRIHAHHPSTKIVVLTTYSDETSILDALRAGALGYLTKDAGRDHIAQAIHTAAAGQAVLDPTIHARLLAATAQPPAHPDATVNTTRRAHHPRNRSPHPTRRRTLQHRNRPTTLRQRNNHQNPHQPHLRQNRRRRPRPSRPLRLPTPPHPAITHQAPPVRPRGHLIYVDRPVCPSRCLAGWMWSRPLCAW
jgi:DNA-binding NarL/FixJ family response regulator